MTDHSIRPDQCRFCKSRCCRTRIHTRDYGFDELACYRHIKQLEHLADGTLGINNGVMRCHVSSTIPMLRGALCSCEQDEKRLAQKQRTA